jgi:hypothetical protein
MDPTVVAAIIAAVVSVLTLVGTLVAQYLGFRATSRDTEKTLKEQHEHLDRHARGAEHAAGPDAWGTANPDMERAVRHGSRPDSSVSEQVAFKSSREVRHTVIRVITAHLRHGTAVSWQGLNFDFTGILFDGGDFSEAQFSGGTVLFTSAEFSGSQIDFGDAEDWSFPPDFRWTGMPPSGVRLPTSETA